MATLVKFTGRAGIRELAADDLKKAGVEGFTKKQFPKGIYVEVEDEAADALVGNEALFGKFEKVTKNSDQELDIPAADAPAKKK